MVIVGVTLGLDQLIKYWLGKQDAVINPGVALGLWPADWWWLVGLVLVAYLWFTHKGWGGGLIIGGALGNILDRWLRGGVVDVWQVWVLPKFNLADVAIIVGSLWILVNRK